jgi:hypothetical protein|tara:strand:- start:2618 stop:3214 length:597 start_codon:yes stop_codon:yes gene_type:complete
MLNEIEHFYQKIQGWFNFHALYQRAVMGHPSGSKFVEVGSWKGCSSVFMGVEILYSGKDIEFFCVDTWSGSEEHLNESSDNYEEEIKTPDWLYNQFIKNIEPVKDYIKPIRKESVEAAKDFEDESLDFVFIDASHDYDNVLADLNAWFPKIKKEPHSFGRFCGHDVWAKGVQYAVVEFCKEHDFLMKVMGENCWIITE